MASTVGYATLSIIPSLSGIDSAIRGQLRTPLVNASGEAGDEASKSFGGKFASGMKTAAIAASAVFAAGLVGAGVGLVALGGKFDEAFDTIRTGTGKTGQALEGLKTDFREVLKDVPTDFGSAGTAITGLSQRLDLTGAPLQTLSKQFLELSRITGTDLNTNIESLTRTLGDAGIAPEKMSSALDTLFRTTQATGVPIARLSDLMTKFGAPTRQLGFSFEQSAALLGKFEKEGVNTELVMGSMRIALGKLARAGEPAQETFARTVEAIKNTGTASEANALALELFGARAGPDMAAAIREGRFEIGALFEQIAGGTDTIIGAGKETQDFGEKWTLIKNRVFLALEPVATRLFDLLGSAMDRLGPVVDEIAGGFTAFFAAFRAGDGDVTSSGLPGFMERLANVARQVVDAIVDAWPRIRVIATQVFAAVVSAIRPVAQALRDVLPSIMSLARDGFSALLTGVRGVLPLLQKLAPVVGSVLAVIIRLAGWLARNRDVLIAIVAPLATIYAGFKLLLIAQKVSAAIAAMRTAIIAMNVAMAANPAILIAAAVVGLGAAIFVAYKRFKPFRDVVDAVGRALRTAFEWVVDHWKLLGAILLGPFLPFIALPVLIIKNWSTVVGFFTALPDQILGALRGVFDWVVNNWPLLVALLVAPFLVVVGTIINHWETILQFFKDLPGKITGLLAGLGTLLLEAGKQLLRGLFEGIKLEFELAKLFWIQLPANILALLVLAQVWLIETGKKVIVGLFLGIVNAWVEGAKFFVNLIPTIVGLIGDAPNALAGLGAALIEGLARGVRLAAGIVGQGAGTIGRFFVDLPGNILELILQGASELVKAGKNIVEKIIDGIKSAPGKLIDAIESLIPGGGLIGDAIGKVGGLFGFAEGGIVPGPVGRPVLAVVHGGEEVIPPGQRGGPTYNIENFYGNPENFFTEAERRERKRMLLAVPA